MGVKVKHWKGAYWLFINHNGKRKARRVGVGRAGQRAADAAAIKIQARLAEGDTGPLEDSTTAAPTTFRSYAESWVETHAKQACKFSTTRVYRTNLNRHILPILGDRPVATISRKKGPQPEEHRKHRSNSQQRALASDGRRPHHGESRIPPRTLLPKR